MALLFASTNKATDAMREKDMLQRNLAESQKQLQATIDDIKVSKISYYISTYFRISIEFFIYQLLYHDQSGKASQQVIKDMEKKMAKMRLHLDEVTILLNTIT